LHISPSLQRFRILATLPENPRVGGSNPSLATNIYKGFTPSFSMGRLFNFRLNGIESVPITLHNLQWIDSMPRKKKRGYGDYTEYIDGDLYGSVSIPDGQGGYKRRRKKVDTKTDARNWALAELDRAKHGSDEPVETFADLAKWYKEHFLVEPVYERGLKVEGVKDWKKQQSKLDRIAGYFAVKRLANFTETDLRTYARERRKEVTQATINRDLALIRAMFRKGRETFKIAVPRFPIQMAGEVERDRVMSFDEEKRILQACNEIEVLEYERKGKQVTANHKTNRQHLRDIVIFAVDTALRQNELFQIEWRDVSTFINVRAEISKTGKARKVPITSRVQKILDALPRTSVRIFPRKRVSKSFATACKRAEVKDLRFHDLRHTATTRMIASGIPHTEVMKITGHSQIKTFLRYLNPEDESVLAAASRLDALLNE
jgi:integrase